jgi:hypothetical protein
VYGVRHVGAVHVGSVLHEIGRWRGVAPVRHEWGVELRDIVCSYCRGGAWIVLLLLVLQMGWKRHGHGHVVWIVCRVLAGFWRGVLRVEARIIEGGHVREYGLPGRWRMGGRRAV